MTSSRQSQHKAIRWTYGHEQGSALDPIQRAIGDKLRMVYDDVLHQLVPERFALLLKKLEAQERSS